MTKLTGTLFSLIALASVGSTAEAAVVRGSNCVDIKASLTCKGNVVSGTGTVTNCSTRADTFFLNAKAYSPTGTLEVDESQTLPLGGGKTYTLPVNFEIWSGTEAGSWKIVLTADAEKGTALKTYTLYLTAPCP